MQKIIRWIVLIVFFLGMPLTLFSILEGKLGIVSILATLAVIAALAVLAGLRLLLEWLSD